jgi:O-antigen ligase
MNIISKQLAGILIATGLVIILALNIFLIQPISLSLVLTAGLILAILYLYNPLWGILLFIAIRPSIDQFSEKLSINIGDTLVLSGSSFLGILLIILSAILLSKSIKKIPRQSLLIFWMLYLLSILISIIFSIDKAVSLYEFIRVLSIFMIFINALILIRNKKDFAYSIYAVLVSAIIPVLLALYQMATGSGIGSNGLESRLFGTFTHPNAFASFIVIIISLIAFLIIKEKNTKEKNIANWILYTIFFISIIILLATFSRGALLAFIVFIFILSLLKSPKYILFVAIFFIVVFSVSQDFRDRTEDIYNPPADSSIRWRFQQWNKIYELYTENPIKGYGAGTETIVHEKEFGFYAGNPYTHNDVLRSALETGILGVITFTLLWIATIFTLFIQFLKTKEKSKKLFLLLIFALITAEFVFSMSSNIFRGTATQWTLWFLIGITLASPRNTKK